MTFKIFDWKNPNITNWRKTYRIALIHRIEDIKCRGISAQEVAIQLLEKHKKKLKKDEIKFLEGLLK